MVDMTDDESDRGVLDVLMGAAAGSALLPFVQAIVTKGGEDVYAKIKELLSRPDRKRTKDEIKDSGTVTLFSDDTRVVLRMPSRMTPQMTERLKLVRLPPRGDEWLRVSWDNAKNQWVVRECDPPDELTSGR
ncbi:hypothetical protein SAMN04488074_102191 [Lentzea albidocapillata subsp. violacea]|uniref:Uncharacterized protein n=2 Tax=Lentzea albidocapillata TaxID=40571 RepID=A0A1G8U5L2_9PSEU|nr:hypothetical protein SAMN04488074_102191 [Lentzea albidocapillata subsp. violacea]